MHTICTGIYAWRKIQFNYCPILARGHNWLTFQIQECKGSRGYPAVSLLMSVCRGNLVCPISKQPFWDYCDISYKVNGCGKGSCVVYFHSLLWECYPDCFDIPFMSCLWLVQCRLPLLSFHSTTSEHVFSMVQHVWRQIHWYMLR